MHIVIPLDPASKKNSARIVYAGGRPRIIPSAAFMAYQEAAGAYLLPIKPAAPISAPVQVSCLFFRRTRRRVDLVNLLEAIDDVLTHYGILADDNSRVIVSHDGSRVLYDKASPRTEITITAMEGDAMGL